MAKSTYKLKDDSTIIYPFGAQCTGFANQQVTQKVKTRSGEEKEIIIAHALNEDVIAMYIDRNDGTFEELFVEVGGAK